MNVYIDPMIMHVIDVYCVHLLMKSTCDARFFNSFHRINMLITVLISADNEYAANSNGPTGLTTVGMV